MSLQCFPMSRYSMMLLHSVNFFFLFWFHFHFLAQEEFEELCFRFGIELDDVVSTLRYLRYQLTDVFL